MHYLVTGGAGFIGSHMTKRLLADGHSVAVIDNLLTGSTKNIDLTHPKLSFFEGDICDLELVKRAMQGCDGVFHFAAIARTPWCIEDPILCMKVNLLGTTVVLEAARQLKIKRCVLSSSSVVYAAETPYKASKLGLEQIALAYREMFKMSIVCLRYSNVYGPGQSEEGPSPNVFAALRASKKKNGYLEITGDGTQTRAYTHVSDIVEGNWLAMQSAFSGEIDLTTGINTALNDVAKYFECEIKYIPERHGDIKHIVQSPALAERVLGWKAKVLLADGIKDVL